jgi:hypothetical protein
MRAVLIVQVTGDDVVPMIAVRNGLMSARVAVRMRLIVFAAGVTALAVLRICARDAESVLVDVLIVHVVQVTIVQVVDVIVVTDGRVAAARAVRVRVCFVGLVVH